MLIKLSEKHMGFGNKAAWLAILIMIMLPPAFGTNSERVETLGSLYPIEEEHLLEAIQKKLEQMQASGELAKKQEAIQKRLEQQMESPSPVQGIGTAEKNTVWYKDPSVVLTQPILGAFGELIAEEGQKINPLEKMAMTRQLFFFDGRQPEQVELAKRLAESIGNTFTPILIAGSWAELSKTLGQAVYFDQQGKMSKQFGLVNIPALIKQEGMLLRVEEIKP